MHFWVIALRDDETCGIIAATLSTGFLRSSEQ
jgi:hypothetical protein